MMRTLLLLVCMVLGLTVELAGTLRMSCRSRYEAARATLMATAQEGQACALERACSASGERAGNRCEWRCGCCRSKSPVAITLVRVAPLPMTSTIAPPALRLAGWPVHSSVPPARVHAVESPPPRA